MYTVVARYIYTRVSDVYIILFQYISTAVAHTLQYTSHNYIGNQLVWRTTYLSKTAHIYLFIVKRDEPNTNVV